MISATHQNLRQLVAEGTFRHDLFFRLLTFEIEMPPLGDRLQDLPALANYFLEILAAKTGQPRRASPPTRSPTWSAAPGTATSASCATPWNTR